MLLVFFFGFFKSKVYANKPMTTHTLKEEIEHCISEIQLHLCKTGCVPTRPWMLFTQYGFAYITLCCMLYESLTKLQFLIINLFSIKLSCMNFETSFTYLLCAVFYDLVSFEMKLKLAL